jgi:hypothetical protein
MADTLTSAEHIVRLSSIDQSTSRYYVRLALCYQRNETNLRDIIDRLTPAIKHTIARFPILAGVVRSETGGTNNQERRLEVVITLDKVNNFKPIMKSMIGLNVKSYEALCAGSVPSFELINGLMTPLPDTPNYGEGPVFAVQVNSIDGGYIVALYLHHCVGDFATLRAIIYHISGELLPRELTPDDLQEYATDQSSLRDVLSDSRGYKPEFVKLVRFAHVRTTQTAHLTFQIEYNAPNNSCCLFSFDIKLLNEVTSIVNARASEINEPPTTRVTPYASKIFERPKLRVTPYAILTAILWKAITRARVNRGVRSHASCIQLSIC